MKKILITAVLAVMPFIASAQTAFDRFKDVEGIDFINIEKDMFKMLSNFEASFGDEKTAKYVDLIKGVDNLKVFTTKEKKLRKQITSAVGDYLKQHPLEQLMSFSSKESKIRIYVNPGGEASLIKEGLVFIEDIDDKGVVLLSFTGDVNLNGLRKADELKK